MSPIHLAICSVLLLLSLVVPAAAQDHFVGSGFNYFPPPASPAALSWRLATQGGEFVELVVPPVTHSVNQIVYFVTPSNAVDYGLDFAAWSTAVNDAAYNRSIMSFGDVVHEQPWSNPWIGSFELERVQLFVNSFDGISSSSGVQGGVVDFIPVPEPVTWLMVCSIGPHLFARRRFGGLHEEASLRGMKTNLSIDLFSGEQYPYHPDNSPHACWFPRIPPGKCKLVARFAMPE